MVEKMVEKWDTRNELQNGYIANKKDIIYLLVLLLC